MSEVSYITAEISRTLAEHPSAAVTVLEYACVVTLLIAVASDFLLRRRRLARQKTVVKTGSKITRR